MDRMMVKHGKNRKKKPEFFSEPKNLIFGIGADGVNPNKQMTSKYYAWPVNVIIYNIPPKLATKNAFMMLPLIIPNIKQPKNIDVYLRPLLEEVKFYEIPDVWSMMLLDLLKHHFVYEEWQYRR